MSESLSLGELVAAEHPAVAWPSDWAGTTKRLFTTTSAGLGQPTLLNSASIEEVLTCPGWWAGQREVDESELSMAGFTLKATRRVARRWLAENLSSAGAVHPLTFTGQVLHRFAATDDLLGHWIRMMPAGQLAELRAEVAMGLVRLDADWPNRTAHASLVPGAVSARTRLGRMTLTSELVDSTVCAASVVDGGFEAGATLVSFTMTPPTPARLEGLGPAVLLHGLRTGCPPARIVSWDLVGGTGIARSVDNDFVLMWCERVCEATRRIGEMQSWFEPRLNGGEHCQICPLFDRCPAADRSEYAW
jgi:hypothetical protein